MCFSTKASFGATIVLTGIGVVALSMAKTKSQRAVAIMPLLFAAQQFSEGVLWISLTYPEYGYLKQWAMYSFLFFAEMVWPVYIPFISATAEQSPERKRRIIPLLAFGAIIVATLVYGLIAFPTDAVLSDGHIWYILKFPIVNYWYYGLIYFLPTIVAPLMSGYKMFRVLAISLLLAYIGSRMFYNPYVISIWCYFGAMISVLSIVMIREMGLERQMKYSFRKADADN